MTPTRSFLVHLQRGVGPVLVLFLLMIGIEDGQAQSGPSLRSVDRPVRVSIDPVGQYYQTSDDQEITQLSTYLSASVPIGRRFTVQARAGYAQTGGNDLTTVQGLTDATGRVQYAQPAGDGSVVFSTAVNVPVGEDQLSERELTTTRIASRNFYDFRVSSYSRGWSITPRLTWAVPVNDQLAFGIGASYEHQRGFRPTSALSSDSLYVPGDGIGINGGLDYKLNESSALGVDLSFRRYGTDEIDGNRRFETGNQISGTVRYLRRSGFTTIRAVARYANWGESEFGYRFGDPDRGDVLPSHAMVLGSYKTQLTEVIDIRVRASGHHYEDTIASDRKLLGRLHLEPSFDVGEWAALSPHGTATVGSYLGLGGGVRISGTF